MGDRIKKDDTGLWYSGRSGQEYKDFELEQKVYQFLKSSLSFITKHKNGINYFYLILSLSYNLFFPSSPIETNPFTFSATKNFGLANVIARFR